MWNVRVAAHVHTQNWGKKWSAESEANGLSCEAARENSQPTSTKQYITPLFICISNHYFSFSWWAFCWKEDLWRGLKCCSLENICLQWWLCFTCIEEKLEQNSILKPLLLTLMTLSLTVQKKLLKFRQVRSRSQVSFFLTKSVRLSVIVASLIALQSKTREQPGLERPGAV